MTSISDSLPAPPSTITKCLQVFLLERTFILQDRNFLFYLSQGSFLLWFYLNCLICQDYSNPKKLLSLRTKVLCLRFLSFFFFFKILFLYFYREQKARRQRGRETSMCERLVASLRQPRPATQACALTGNRTGDLSVHRSAVNPLSHTSQDLRFLITTFFYIESHVE